MRAYLNGMMTGCAFGMIIAYLMSGKLFSAYIMLLIFAGAVYYDRQQSWYED